MAVDLRRADLDPSKMDNHEMMSELMLTLAEGVVLDGDKPAAEAIKALMSAEKVRGIVGGLPSDSLREILAFVKKEDVITEKFSEDARKDASDHRAAREEKQKGVQEALSQGSKSRG